MWSYLARVFKIASKPWSFFQKVSLVFFVVALVGAPQWLFLWFVVKFLIDI
jgi:hypothetical protein